MKSSSEIMPPPTKRRRLLDPSTLGAAPSIPSRPILDLKSDHLRIFSWNLNGIDPFLQPTISSYFTRASLPPRHGSVRNSARPDRLASFRECLKRWKYPQILCLQEIKIASHDDKTMRAVQQAVKPRRSQISSSSEQETNYRTFFNLPTDQFNARGLGGKGKLYGVCTLVREDFLEKEAHGKDSIFPVAWDSEGRVLVLELAKRKLAIFNVYAVNGTDYPYRSPRTGAVIGTRHDRKRTFHTELKHACESYEQRGWKVVIAGDLNIAPGSLDGFPGIRLADAHVKNRADFAAKFLHPQEIGGLAMLDTYRLLHGEERKYSYRPRGIPWGTSCDRVDLILASHTLSQRLLEADLLDDEAERGPSDHVPLYLTLSILGDEQRSN